MATLRGPVDGVDMDESRTKGELREYKRRNRRKMKVVGRSVRLLQEIIRKKAEKIRKKSE